jgi:hypothetical protein
VMFSETRLLRSRAKLREPATIARAETSYRRCSRRNSQDGSLTWKPIRTALFGKPPADVASDTDAAMTERVDPPTAPTRKCKCDLCNGEMKYLGETRTVRGPAVSLFAATNVP